DGRRAGGRGRRRRAGLAGELQRDRVLGEPVAQHRRRRPAGRRRGADRDGRLCDNREGARRRSGDGRRRGLALVNLGRKAWAMTKTSKATGAPAAVGGAAALGATTSCGGVSGSDVNNARNQATTASCNYFMMCNQIGPGMSAKGAGYYDTYQD